MAKLKQYLAGNNLQFDGNFQFSFNITVVKCVLNGCSTTIILKTILARKVLKFAESNNPQ
jgi:hypothetical protein